jgi:cell division protein FtsW (lipid II flippase)
MARRWIPRVCAAIFVCGIAGLIVTSIAGNNNGWVLTVGAAIVLAAVALLTHSAVTGGRRIDEFVDADAEALEQHIQRLVHQGADEAEVRALVRAALQRSRS